MPTAAEHARILQLPMAEMTSLAEKAAVNTASTTYASIELALMQKLAACKEAVNAENVKQPQRVYVQHAVETVDRALLRQAFPKWDIKFSGVDPRANAKAQAIYFLMAQFLLDKLNQKKGLVLAYGVSLKQIVMRNRRWMHVCVAGQDVVEQAEFRRDDRAIMAMSKSWERAGKSYDLAREFAEGNTDCYCGDPRTCKKEAAAAIMMLHRTDTNFRQIAYYMQKHKVKLLYFAVPGSKHLEFGSQGHMPDLGGYVFPTVQDGKMRVNITYNGDISLDVSYDHQNYLELIGRTSVVLGDTCYHKEHVTQVLGVHVYKVTAFDAEAADSRLPPYLSWNEPNYKSLYVLHVPLLKPHGSVHIRADWEMYTYTVERDVIDSVTDWAMRADGVKDMAKSIERRLASKLTRVAGHGQVVPVNSYMAVDQFDLTALVIFVTVFMKKYVHGKTVSTVAPQARELAALSSAGVWSLARHYIVARTAEMSGWLGKCTAALRSNIGYSETSRDVPLPRFVAAVGYTPYDNAAFNPMFSSWDVGDNPVHGFSPCLPGVKPKFFDLDEQSQSDTSSESTMPYSDVQKLVVSGEAVVTSDGRIRMLDSEKSVKIGQASASIYDKVVTWVGDAYGDLKLTGTVDDDDEIQDMLLRRTFGDDILEEPEPVLGAIDDSGSDDSESLSDTEDTIEVVIPTVQQRHDQVHRAVTAADEMRRRLGGESRHADSLGVSAKYIIETEPRTRYQSHEPIVNEIVNRVYHDTGHMSTLQAHTIGVLTTYDAAAVPDIVLGAVSDDPKADLTDALNIIFPGATTYNTAYFNSDKHFSDFDLKIKSTKIAIDLTKMGTLRPESLYKPKVRSHVVPDSKNSMVDTLWTVQKRYANTPADADSLSLDDVFQHAWSCALKVYYVPEAQDILDSLPYIGPTEESIRVCVSNMDAKKRERLLNSPDGYTCAELLFGLQNNQFMIKPKTKPDLTSTYASSLKAPQGIQYDASGRSIPVFTPIISAAVMREQSILRPNFLVMQQKNLSDVNEFLNRFDWRPNERGERYYIEIDYSEYDKSQGPTARAMFWKKMELFKVLPDFLQFYRAATTNRSVAALKAGIKAWIDEQNPSGLSHTLASNTDVNLMATAELLYRIVDQIEFGMVMGDDFTLAVRGFPDISQWEAEINRKFNLSMKVAVHRHGYFCSMDIVHYPDGHSRVIADIVKRALVFTQQSVKDISNFDEKFISYADSLNGVQDKQVQLYLQSALPDRYRHLLPGLSQEAVKLLCKLHAKIRVDYDAFRGFFAEESTVTYY